MFYKHLFFVFLQHFYKNESLIGRNQFWKEGKMNIERIIKKAIKGDSKSFTLLIEQYQDMLYRIAKLRLSSEDDICDAVQETLISAYKGIVRLEEPKFFKTWLVKILINKCNNYYRKPYREDISLDDLKYERVESVNSDLKNNSFEEMIESLTEEEKTIITLFYKDGYKEKEIAEILNINYATIRSKINRAKQKLSVSLREEII